MIPVMCSRIPWSEGITAVNVAVICDPAFLILKNVLPSLGKLSPKTSAAVSVAAPFTPAKVGTVAAVLVPNEITVGVNTAMEILLMINDYSLPATFVAHAENINFEICHTGIC
jgi:hypothetical protein